MRATRQILTSIDGSSERDIYVVGTGGVIFHNDGFGWQSLQSPTNFGLMRVRCYEETTYICGYHGLLLRGGRQGWQVLHHQHGNPPLLDMVMYRDQLYAASEYALFRLNGDALEQIKPDIAGEMPLGVLSSVGSALVSVGGESVLLFDGKAWYRIECPWNLDQ
jgi:hypothetical protein